MEDRMTVPVRVPKYIRDYIRGINADSDVVVPEYHSLLWATVKANLDLVPRDGLPPLNPESTYIHITIYSSKHRKIYNIASGKSSGTPTCSFAAISARTARRRCPIT